VSTRTIHGALAAALVRRPFSSTAARSRDHHFDTLKFVQRLQGEGFSEEQATAMMRVLSDVIEESIQNLTRTMVLREGMSPTSRPGAAATERHSRQRSLPRSRRR
jgi:hypothetical protein